LISINAGVASFDLKAMLKFANDSAGAKGGPHKGPPFSLEMCNRSALCDRLAPQIEFTGVGIVAALSQAVRVGPKALT